MSKASQRKQSFKHCKNKMIASGKRDAKMKRPPQWVRHPLKFYYMIGYKHRGPLFQKWFRFNT